MSNQRRMISLKVTDTDLFLEMPATARLLYYELLTRADDDGFVSSPNKIMRLSGCMSNDLDVLKAKQLVLNFESGVLVIKHWRIHNTIRKDRYTPTIYTNEFKQLQLLENKEYIHSETVGIPDGNQLETQIKLNQVKSNKVNLNKSNLNQNKSNEVKSNKTSTTKKPKPTKHKYGEFKKVLLTDEEIEKLKNKIPNTYLKLIDNLDGYLAQGGGSGYKSHYHVLLNWNKRDKEKESKSKQPEPEWLNDHKKHVEKNKVNQEEVTLDDIEIVKQQIKDMFTDC